MIPKIIKFNDIVNVAKKHMNPTDIDHHDTDLYLKVNGISAQIVHNIVDTVHVSTFSSNIEPHVPWYEIWWAYHE